MTPAADALVGLVRDLCALPTETEWVEFKVNNCQPDEIGEYISALSNSAVLAGEPSAYLVWGIENVTHRIVGTSFSPRKERVGNEELENWLHRLLSPCPLIQFHEFTVDGRSLVMLIVSQIFSRPVRFKGNEFIRIGSYKKRLAEFPERERALWRAFDTTPFEGIIAADHLAASDVLRLLDYPAYFEMSGRPLPQTRDGILQGLLDDTLIRSESAGMWGITNLGAILFAKRLEEFEFIRRKACRVILYDGVSRVKTIREQGGTRGYASGFEGLIGFISGLLPTNEVINQALREDVPMYPALAVRELVANALIHQDFSVTGSGPMVEIFADRMEISNPGIPLISTDRFLDTPPKSRNEGLASLMRRLGVCEERGSGIDKVVFETEYYQLPAPMFEVTGETTRSILFSHRPLQKMEREERVRASYLHACLRYVNHDYMTNTTLRERFGIEQQNSASASRLIKEAVMAGFIKPYDESAARKYMKYVPFWA
jgi:ATP-dependent DNA helicase RecG